MDAAQVLQAVLSAVQSGNPIASVTPATIPTTMPPSSQPTTGPNGEALPPLLPQILFMLLSMSAVRDWIKLFLIGALLEGSRRILAKSWEMFTDYVWVTATFESNDDAADWLMYWLSQRKIFQSARNIEDDLGEKDEKDGMVAFLPSLKRMYSLWYKGRYMTVSRERSSESPYKWRAYVQNAHKDTRLLRGLLVEARKAYKAASEHLIAVHVAESADEWRLVSLQEKRPPSSIILDPGVLELVLNDAKDFLSSKKWNTLPARLSALRRELGLSVYILSLTVFSLDDNSLKSLIGRLPKACIVLVEDIDAAFTRGMKRDIVDTEAQVKPETQADGPKKGGKDATFNGVTLSGLLNALDGIAAQEGRLLFATTNDYSALDPALLRPGRLDLHIEFLLASKYQATELFKRFYTPSTNETPVGANLVDEKPTRDPAQDSSPTVPDASVQSGSPLSADTPIPESVPSAYIDLASMTLAASQLSSAEASELAAQFAEIIPPRTFSMATLQGYLMAYKTRPYVAIQHALAWVEKKLKEKAMQATTVAATSAS
ncbi:BCS1 N terminal-domain-containing protein [Cerioporus squamosus]|nr:BCS1 N terminal-domain-containing protein [Cerioporus squamosus]